MAARSAQAWQSSETEIVVLTNRQTIQGIVQRQKEKVSVRLPSGSLIVLPESRVLFICRTFGEVYWELAAHTRSTDTKGQIDVYKWCVQNQLFDEAANHLLMLQEMDLPAQTLMQLDVSLQLTQKRHAQSQQAIVAAHTKPATVTPTHQQPNANIRWQGDQSIEIPNLHHTAQSNANQISPHTNRLPAIDEFGDEVDSRFDGNVQPVSWDQPISEYADPVPPLRPDETLRRRLSATESLTFTDLDRLTRSMPKGSVGLFRKQIEPMLRQACSECHQSGATENAFEIFQDRRGAINRRMSQKNLFQALNLADRKQPSESKLIRYATVPHGNQSNPSFHWNDAQLKAVKQWLILVSANPALPLEKFVADRNQKQPPRFGTPEVADPQDAALAKPLPAAKSKIKQPSDDSSESADPFDADTFNRKFGPR